MSERESSYEAARLHRQLADLLAQILVADGRGFPDRGSIPRPDEMEPEAETSPGSSPIILPGEPQP